MKRHAACVVVVVALAAGASRAGAEPADRSSPAGQISPESVARAVTATLTREAGRPRGRPDRVNTQDVSTPRGRSRSFLHSGKGIAAVAVLSVGVGYAAYSKIHDRIHTKNPNR